jgi:hypothetical protein
MSRQASPQNGGNGAGQNFNSTLSIVVAVIAVLVGFFILRDINSDSTSPASSPSDDTSVDASGTTVPDAAVTTLPAVTNTTGFKVLVANASGVPGSAGDMSVALQGLGFIVQPPLNKSDATPKQTLTMVYYIAGQEANAANVAAALGGVATAPMPDPVPTETGNMGEASVLVLLATDLAGKPIAGAAAATTVAG